MTGHDTPDVLHKASIAQAKFWQLHLENPDTNIDSIIGYIPVPAQTPTSHVEAVLKEIVDRHESLRTSFRMMPDGLYQASFTGVRPELQEAWLDRGDESAAAAKLADCVARPFDLQAAPLFRTLLVRTGSNYDVVVFALSHIVGDGESRRLIQQEFRTVDQRMRAGREVDLPRPKQYREYCGELAEAMAGRGRLARQRRYWLKQLDGISLEPNLPLDCPRSLITEEVAVETLIELPDPVWQECYLSARARQISPASIMLAATAAAMAPFSRSDEVVIGMLCSNRIGRNKEVVGLLVNGVPIRVFTGDDPSLADLSVRVNDLLLAAYANSEYLTEAASAEIGYGIGVVSSDKPPLWEVAVNHVARQSQRDTHEAEALARVRSAVHVHAPLTPKQQWDGKVCELHALTSPSNLVANLAHIVELPNRVVRDLTGRVSRFVEYYSGSPGRRISDLDA